METDRSIYLSMAELVRRYRAPRGTAGNAPLTSFELRCFSQHGEDGVIAELLARLELASGYFVEFGIESGREGNCVFLADVLGWHGLFIEPDEERYSELQRKYAGNDAVTTLKATVTPDNIEELLVAADVPHEPDVLSIDVDGQDYWVWEALEAYQPSVVIIEYNAALPPGRRLVQPRGYPDRWDGTNYFGASLDALCALAERKGYRLAHTDLAAINAFFIRSDLSSAAAAVPDRVSRRHQPNYFMQGYQHPPDPRHRSYTDLDPRPPGETGAAETPAAARNAPTRELAEELAARTDFVWHQRFELAHGVYTPGVSDIGFLLDMATVPEQLDGLTVLDIGTTNGGAAFECERRGASRVVAVDIADQDWFGFATIRDFLGSRAQHVRSSVYALPELLDEQFDVVLFWGVLYHLRHPLLALDNVRRLARGLVAVETVVSDHLLPDKRDVPLARFFRADEFARDGSIWFAPNLGGLTDWCRSCGLEPTTVRAWPEEGPERAMVAASPTEPEWPGMSYEQPLRCSVPPVTILSTS